MPSEDTFKLPEGTAPSALQQHVQQVGVAFTYPTWFLDCGGHCCSDKRVSTVPHMTTITILFFWNKTTH